MPPISKKKLFSVSLFLFLVVSIYLIYPINEITQQEILNFHNTTSPEKNTTYIPPYYALKLVRPKTKKFKSQILEDHLTSLKPVMKDKDLYTLLQNCLPNTLDTTVEWFQLDDQDPRAFLITGDSNKL